MTETQINVFATICNYWEENKLPPNYDDIAERTNMSRRNARYHIKNLIEMGLVIMDADKRRSMRPKHMKVIVPVIKTGEEEGE
jgi:predicted transcriptional regulator